MSIATIGFIPRERFSLAPEALRRILDYTRIPFNLIVVDCATPAVYWQQMEEMLRGRENVKVIRLDRHLLPNQCRNLVIPEVKDEFVCFIENDNLVEEGWLSRFLSSAEKHRADVVIPLIMEGRPGTAKVHFDDDLGSVRTVQTPNGPRWEIVPRLVPKERDMGGKARAEQFMETHCLFFRTDVFGRIGPFDEQINTSEEIDVSLALYQAKCRAVLDPECVIHYVQPPIPVCPDDRSYFLTKWDIRQAHKSHDHLQRKWNLVRMPQLLGFVEERNLKGTSSLGVWREELAALVGPGQRFILADLDEWRHTEIVDGLQPIPFCEHQGQYWGPPADDDAAIKEFERLKSLGPSHIVFAWQAFWYRDYYAGLNRLLQSRYPCVRQNDHMIAFDLGGAAPRT